MLGETVHERGAPEESGWRKDAALCVETCAILQDGLGNSGEKQRRPDVAGVVQPPPQGHRLLDATNLAFGNEVADPELFSICSGVGPACENMPKVKQPGLLIIIPRPQSHLAK